MNRENAPAAPVSTLPVSIVVPANEGTVLKAFGDTLQVKLSGTQTQGALVVFQDTSPPGGGPPPHIHHREDELFIVIDGRFRFLVNEQWTEVLEAGAVVFAPRGALHTFQNVGDTPGRFWGITTPSNFEQYFARCAAVFAETSPPDMARILAISAEHGLEFVSPPPDAPNAAV